MSVSNIVGVSNNLDAIYNDYNNSLNRDSTNLGTATGMTKANADNQESMCITILDSPSSTSQITYQLAKRNISVERLIQIPDHKSKQHRIV